MIFESPPPQPTTFVAGDYETRLRRLLKGILYVLITGLYVAVVLAVFFGTGWKAAILTILLIAFSLALRFVGDEIYRIGKMIGGGVDSETAHESAQSLKTRFYIFCVVLVHVIALGLLGQIYVVAPDLSAFFNSAVDYYFASNEPVTVSSTDEAASRMTWVLVVLLDLVSVEMGFIWIRKINESIAYRTASYGNREGDPFGITPSDPSVQRRIKEERLENRITELSQMVEEGKISREVFEKQRDKYRIRHVMERDD